MRISETTIAFGTVSLSWNKQWKQQISLSSFNFQNIEDSVPHNISVRKNTCVMGVLLSPEMEVTMKKKISEEMRMRGIDGGFDYTDDCAYGDYYLNEKSVWKRYFLYKNDLLVLQ